MAVTLPPSVSVGDATKKEIFDNTRSSLSDLDTRLTTQENGSGKIFVFNFRLANSITAASLTGIDLFKANFAFTLTDAKVQIGEVGSLTGTAEIDVKKNSSPAAAGFTSVFTTNPSVDYGTASDFEISSNAVFDSNQISISSGDYLRLDFTSLPSGGVGNFFYVSVIGEL